MQGIAYIRSDFTGKFGIPRQSGIIETLQAEVVFAPEYRNADALRGLEGFSHIWLIWQFSEAVRATWSPTVRPPRLGGNQRVGVFASRSPFRPNPIGLSAVRLTGIAWHVHEGPILQIAGADVMHGTPIYDIKPYVPYADCLVHATGGFANERPVERVEVDFPAVLLARVPPEKRQALVSVLAHDPRPAYKNNPQHIYKFEFAGLRVCFQVEGTRLVVCEVSAA